MIQVKRMAEIFVLWKVLGKDYVRHIYISNTKWYQTKVIIFFTLKILIGITGIIHVRKIGWLLCVSAPWFLLSKVHSMHTTVSRILLCHVWITSKSCISTSTGSSPWSKVLPTRIKHLEIVSVPNIICVNLLRSMSTYIDEYLLLLYYDTKTVKNKQRWEI